MFLGDKEITPEKEEALREAGIVIAHNQSELLLKGDSADLTATGSKLSWLLRQWLGPEATWEALAGRRVLDIAAGSIFTTDFAGNFPPHFSRLCAVNGADVSALDLHTQGPQDSELFRGLKVDLVYTMIKGELKNQPYLEGMQFDLIHSEHFVGHNPDPELKRYLGKINVTLEDFTDRLFNQCIPLLAEGGIMSLDLPKPDKYKPLLHRKVQGQIVTF